MSYQLVDDGQYGKAQIFDRDDLLQSVRFEELTILLVVFFRRGNMILQDLAP